MKIKWQELQSVNLARIDLGGQQEAPKMGFSVFSNLKLNLKIEKYLKWLEEGANNIFLETNNLRIVCEI